MTYIPQITHIGPFQQKYLINVDIYSRKGQIQVKNDTVCWNLHFIKKKEKNSFPNKTKKLIIRNLNVLKCWILLYQSQASTKTLSFLHCNFVIFYHMVVIHVSWNRRLMHSFLSSFVILFFFFSFLLEISNLSLRRIILFSRSYMFQLYVSCRYDTDRKSVVWQIFFVFIMK